MKSLSLKMPESLNHRLMAMAKRRHMPKSAVVREALEQYLDQRHEVSGQSFLELADDLVGCVKDAPANLSVNPKNLDGYGW